MREIAFESHLAHLPLLAVVAEHLTGQPKGHATHLGEPFIGGVGRVVALLAVPDRVDVRVELGVRQVRVARARRVQVEHETVGPPLRHQRPSQATKDLALVRCAIEVDAVDVEVAHKPKDPLDPVVVPS